MGLGLPRSAQPCGGAAGGEPSAWVRRISGARLVAGDEGVRGATDSEQEGGQPDVCVRGVALRGRGGERLDGLVGPLEVFEEATLVERQVRVVRLRLQCGVEALEGFF